MAMKSLKSVVTANRILPQFVRNGLIKLKVEVGKEYYRLTEKGGKALHGFNLYKGNHKVR